MVFVITLLIMVGLLFLFKYVTNIFIIVLFFAFGGIASILSDILGGSIIIAVIIALIGATIIFLLLPYSDFAFGKNFGLRDNKNKLATLDKRIKVIEDYLVSISDSK